MGQAKRKKELWATGKRARFLTLMRKISKYSEQEIMGFAKRRYADKASY